MKNLFSVFAFLFIYPVFSQVCFRDGGCFHVDQGKFDTLYNGTLSVTHANRVFPAKSWLEYYNSSIPVYAGFNKHQLQQELFDIWSEKLNYYPASAIEDLVENADKALNTFPMVDVELIVDIADCFWTHPKNEDTLHFGSQGYLLVFNCNSSLGMIYSFGKRKQKTEALKKIAVLDRTIKNKQ